MYNSNEDVRSSAEDDDADDLGDDGSRYDSAIGWDPNREALEAYEKERERYRKKNPREFAELPEILLVDETRSFIDSGCEYSALAELVGPLWRSEELAILFAPTGVGKSLFATQIAECLARGRRLEPFADRKGTEFGPQRVLYVDFEIDRWQLAERYSLTDTDGVKRESPYRPSPNFLRAEAFWNGKIIDGYKNFADMMLVNIQAQVDAFDATVLILDNISFLTQGNSTSSALAFQIMDRLRALKKDLRISILVIAHTPKFRRAGHLTDRHLQGTSEISKVADSIMAIGRSRQSPDLRYVKQIKSRSGRIEFGEDNVIVYRLERFDLAARFGLDQNEAVRADNFLGFNYVSSEPEEEHYVKPTGSGDEKRRGPKLDIHLIRTARRLAGRGLSSSAIAERLGVPRTTAFRYSRRT